MAKKEQNNENTRTAIRETAAALFRSGGIHSSSLADIAKAAKLSKGTPYYYYPSKEYLIADIAETHLSRMTDQLFNWIDGLGQNQPAKEAVGALIDALLEDQEELRLHYVLQCEALREDENLKRRFAAKAREWAVMLEVGSLKMSGPGAERFRSLSRNFFALLDGFGLHILMGEALDPKRLLTLLTEEGS